MSATEETNLVRRIMLAVGSLKNIRVFRNNTGRAWIGKSTQFNRDTTVNVKRGDVLIQDARFFVAGLCVGSSDLIGYKSVVVTPEMVGKPIAVFTGIEVKTATGRISPEQKAFIEVLNDKGGIGIVCRSESEALEFLNKKP